MTGIQGFRSQLPAEFRLNTNHPEHGIEVLVLLLGLKHQTSLISFEGATIREFSLKRLIFTSSIDLLLGLLTYLAWSTDAFLGRADLIYRLMMLALSIVYDLRLFKASSPDV